MRSILLGGLMMVSGLAMASDCVAPQAAPETAVAAIAHVPASTLAWAPAERQPVSVDAVLARDAYERCTRLAQASGGGDGYQKQTEFDNTPYRFNMKPGEKMSAEQFDAWMASRGIRIVRAKTEDSATTPATVGQ